MAKARNFLLAAVCLLSVAGLISAFALGNRTLEETAEEIISVLSQRNFDDWSREFISINDPVLGKTLPATLFVPLSGNVHGGDPRHLAAYHIIPEHLCFDELLTKDDSILLQTLLPGFSILLAKSSTGLTVDGVEIVERDVFVDSVMVVHRIASPLDSSKFGGGTVTPSSWKLWSILLCIMLSAVVAFCVKGGWNPTSECSKKKSKNRNKNINKNKNKFKK